MNEHRPIGPRVDGPDALRPDRHILIGRTVRLETLRPAEHGALIWPHIKDHPHVWDYLYETPPHTIAEFVETLELAIAKPDWFGYAICLPDNKVLGYAFYLNCVSSMRTIEVGNINYSPSMQRRTAATEAMYLMMDEAFRLGYRRYEWKCNALNAPSRRAAQRLGFSWEGIFRQHLIVKGHNRDTAWFALTDKEWPAIRRAFNTWLAEENFDTDGRQRQSLSDLTAPHRVAGDPDQAERAI